MRVRGPRGVEAWCSAVALSVSVGACSKGCSTDHPYVPYAIKDAPSAAPSASASHDEKPEKPVAKPTVQVAAAVAPPGLSEWALEGVTLKAPEHTVFLQAVVFDFDGDGAPDALALLRPDDDPLGLRALYFHGVVNAGALAPSVVNIPRPSAGKLEATSPEPTHLPKLPAPDTEERAPPAASSDVPPPSSPTAPVVPGVCRSLERLVRTGAHSAAVSQSFECEGASPPRWIASLAIEKDVRVRAGLTLIDPAFAPALTADFLSDDLDGDGVDDLTLRVTLDSPKPPLEPGPSVTGTFKWFDRPAGLSRDTETPEASFRSLAQAATWKAGRAKEAPQVAADLTQSSALLRAVCPDAGRPRIVPFAGVTLPNCSSSRAIADLAIAEVRSFITTANAASALAAYDRWQQAPVARPEPKWNELRQAILALAPLSRGAKVRRVAAVPLIERSPAPAWGALAFEPAGTLLVRTVAGVVRVEPELGDETPAPEVPAWPSEVVFAFGSYRLSRVVDACRDTVLQALFTPTQGGETKSLPLPLSPPPFSHCGADVGAPTAVTALSAGPSGVEFSALGSSVLVSGDLAHATPLAALLDQSRTLGGPNSPNGKVWVTPTSLGLLVRGDKPRLRAASELDGTYTSMRDCAVSDDAARIACVKSGRVWVGVWAD